MTKGGFICLTEIWIPLLGSLKFTKEFYIWKYRTYMRFQRISTLALIQFQWLIKLQIQYDYQGTKVYISILP